MITPCYSVGHTGFECVKFNCEADKNQYDLALKAAAFCFSFFLMAHSFDYLVISGVTYIIFLFENVTIDGIICKNICRAFLGNIHMSDKVFPVPGGIYGTFLLCILYDTVYILWIYISLY